MARPTVLLNPESQAVICKAIREGCPKKDAAVHAGVSYTTFKNWVRAGKAKKDELYVAFLAALKKAEADFVADRVANLVLKEEDAWQVSCWLLERRRPADFGDQRKMVKELQKTVQDLSRVVAQLTSGQSIPTPTHSNGTGHPAPASN